MATTEFTALAVGWLDNAGAQHYDEHLPRLREWVAEVLAVASLRYEDLTLAPPAGNVRRIDREELASKLQRRDRFRLVMALNEWAFRAKHIPGSEHFNTSEELFSSLRPNEEVVVYCTSVDCHASLALYHELVARGYRDVRRYEGGLTEWEEAGLPLEGEWAPNQSPSGHAD